MLLCFRNQSPSQTWAAGRRRFGTKPTVHSRHLSAGAKHAFGTSAILVNSPYLPRVPRDVLRRYTIEAPALISLWDLYAIYMGFICIGDTLPLLARDKRCGRWQEAPGSAAEQEAAYGRLQARSGGRLLPAGSGQQPVGGRRWCVLPTICALPSSGKGVWHITAI